MDEGLQGTFEAIRRLEDIGAEDGKFARVALRRALRVVAKMVANTIRQAIRSRTGVTESQVRIKPGPRRKNQISMLAGIFGGARVRGVFYPGFANFGHGAVMGKHWTDEVKAETEIYEQVFAEVLSEELEGICR